MKHITKPGGLNEMKPSRAALCLTCVPGMARNYVGGSPAARFSMSLKLAMQLLSAPVALFAQPS